MATLSESAYTFLAHKRIAVAGVSRRGDTAANVVYKKLRDTSYSVFPVNPQADVVEGDRCNPSLTAIPGGVEAVVIATPPAAAPALVRECAALGIRHVWLHRAFGTGSYSEEAVKLCEEYGITVIPGGCPMMFCEPVDIAHKCFRWYLKVKHRETRKALSRNAS